MCICEKTYIEDDNSICVEYVEKIICHFSCKDCTGSGIDQCSMCASAKNRVFSTNRCECDNKFYEDGNNKC
jgi:hypothetical protein